MAHIHCQKRTLIQIPVLYRNTDQGSESESVQCEMFCTVQYRHWVWNRNPSLYPSPSQSVQMSHYSKDFFSDHLKVTFHTMISFNITV